MGSNPPPQTPQPPRGDTGLFPCPSCASIFKRRDHLGRHLLTQHSSPNGPNLRTKCPFKDCDTEMVRRDHLRRHISQVHKVDPSGVLPYSRRKPFTKNVVDPLKRFKCVYSGCEAELSRKDHLCRHIKNIHKADPRQVIGHMYKQPPPASTPGGNEGKGRGDLEGTQVSKRKKPRGKRKKKEEGKGGGGGGNLSQNGGDSGGEVTPQPPPAHHSSQPHPSTLSDYDYALSYCQLFLK